MEKTKVAHDVSDFETDVVERSRTIPVLVDFWAEWCGPCKVLGPVLEKLAQENDGKWALAKLDTERFPAVAAQYAIRSIPNVKLFLDGEVSSEFVGALPEQKVVDWLRKALPNKYVALLEGARQLVLENRSAEAREILNHIIASESDNEHAVVLLAQTFLASDPQAAVDIVQPIGLGSEHLEAAEAIKSVAAMFKRVDTPDFLPSDSVKDAYVAAIRDARSNNFEAALGGLIEVLRKNRYYDDDGARKACIAIFKLLGEDHEFTKRHRPTFSSALY